MGKEYKVRRAMDIETKVNAALVNTSTVTGISQTKIINQALKEYCEKLVPDETQKEGE